MGQRRRVIPVELTDEQRERLERLWFIYGNYGAKTTPGNHSFIQRLLENGYDERPLYTKRTPKSERPTEECERAVEAVLTPAREADGDRRVKSRLRVVECAPARKRPAVDPEIKGLLEDMKRRAAARRASEVDDTPDAA